VWSFLFPGWSSGESGEARDWRLRVELDGATGVGDLLDRLRGGREEVLGSEIGGSLPFGVVLTRNGDVLFAYASTRSGVDGARRAIEPVARGAGFSADLRVSHWDSHVKAWRQVDPPLSGEERELDEVLAREATRHETRELSYLVRRLDRARVESLILDFAQRRGLDCTVEDKRRLLSIHLTFSVSGPASMLDEFVNYARHVVKSHGLPMGTAGGA